ncbi:Uncharacterised protein [Cedecea neteri]|uniref:Uncharacterized protein n=1 Tax=Cedecea neteri TaxID=158822 RepID=A0A2X3J2W2_9ENTR|nr:Uncharacterised protein [Cedecea neteri]
MIPGGQRAAQAVYQTLLPFHGGRPVLQKQAADGLFSGKRQRKKLGFVIQGIKTTGQAQ